MSTDPTEPKSDHDDFTQSPEYQAFVESMVPFCRCAHDRLCAGVLAGGLCDDIQDEAASAYEDQDEQ